MDLSCFFQPVETHARINYPLRPDCLGKRVDIYRNEFPNWQEAQAVIIGCCEDRGALGEAGQADACEALRAQLYALNYAWPHIRIADLGNLIPKNDLEDVYFTLQYLTEQFLEQDKLVILLGGSQDLTLGLYPAFEKLERRIDYVCIDNMPDIFDAEVGLNHSSFNHRILTHSPNFLNCLTFIGLQNYLISQEETTTLEALGIGSVRVSDFREDLGQAECVLRTADLVSFDLSAMRSSEVPGAAHATAGGLTLEEACRLGRFAGMGYRLGAFHLAELVSTLDTNEQTASVGALVVWHLLDGFARRPDDYPLADRSNLVRYRVATAGPLDEIVFYKNEETRRWWMEVPYGKMTPNSRPAARLVPCSERDHHLAITDGIPDRWWRAQTQNP